MLIQEKPSEHPEENKELPAANPEGSGLSAPDSAERPLENLSGQSPELSGSSQSNQEPNLEQALAGQKTADGTLVKEAGQATTGPAQTEEQAKVARAIEEGDLAGMQKFGPHDVVNELLHVTEEPK